MFDLCSVFLTWSSCPIHGVMLWGKSYIWNSGSKALASVSDHQKKVWRYESERHLSYLNLQVRHPSKRYAKTGDKKTCNLFCNIGAKRVERCCAFYHPRLSLLTSWFVARQVWCGWQNAQPRSLFNSFCSNVAKQVARCLLPVFTSLEESEHNARGPKYSMRRIWDKTEM